MGVSTGGNVETVVGVGEIVETGVVLDIAFGTAEVGAAQDEMIIIVMKTVTAIFMNLPFERYACQGRHCALVDMI